VKDFCKRLRYISIKYEFQPWFKPRFIWFYLASSLKFKVKPGAFL